MRGDEIDRGGQFRIVAPDVPDLAGRHGDVDGFLHLLDQLDQVVDLLLAAENGFVADDDAVDVAVAPGKADRRLDLALVAIGILVDPGADGDLQAELGCDRRHQFHAARRGVEANRARDRRQLLQVGADFFDLRNIVDVGMGAALERRIGDARQDAPEIGRRLLFLKQAPQPGVSCGHKQQNGNDGTHRGLNHTGLRFKGSEPVPWARPTRRHHKDSPALRFHNWYDAVTFLRTASSGRGQSKRRINRIVPLNVS